jgi:uncharacterized membrane-anchored protein YitT (DUF2179 family)
VINWKRTITLGLLLSFGISCAVFGLDGFLIPNHLIDGGVTGVAMLVAKVTGWSLPLLLIFINIPFVAWAAWQMGRRYAVACAISIFGLALSLHFSHLPTVTNDLSLASVFGGVFLGAGMGLVIRGGGALDGTEIFAVRISRSSSLSISDIILIFNTLIFCIATVLLGISYALYSMVTYWSTARIVDYIISGIEEYTGVTVISEKNNEIRECIFKSFHRGVTIYSGKGGYNLREIDIIFCVASKFELPKLRKIITDLDPSAFFFSHRIDEATGGLTKRIMTRP